MIGRIAGRGRNRVQPVIRRGWFNDVVYWFTTALLTKPRVRVMLILHANVNWDFGPLHHVIATPVFHRWHHSKDREAWDKNFADLFPFWNMLFGTFYMPKDLYPENFGICEPMQKKGWLGQMWEPFEWILRREKKVNPL